MCFARTEEPSGAQPHAGFHENRTLFHRPVVAGGEAVRTKIPASRATCECADGHGRVGRAENGCSGFGNGLAGNVRHDGEGWDICSLTLVCCHAERGVTLQMLDRPKSFLMRKLHVRHGHVVLQVEPGPGVAFADVQEGRGLGGLVLRYGSGLARR